MEPTISRFNSQSTSNTLVASDAGSISRTYPSIGGQLPVFKTSDNKQWIDLEVLSPKILRELQYQYERSSTKEEASSPLVKRAARVKAWVRQSKLGIDIRMRRNLNAERDEVTDIFLQPEALAPGIGRELDASDTQVLELPDTSVPSELPTVREPSQTMPSSSTDDPSEEPLPRYEPRSQPHSPVDAPIGSQSNPVPVSFPVIASYSPDRDATRDQPRRAVSLHDPPMTEEATDSLPSRLPPGLPNDNATTRTSKAVQNQEHSSSRKELEEVKRQVQHQKKLSEGLQDLITTLQQELFNKNAVSEETPRPGISPPLQIPLTRLQVVDKNVYETETDVEPPSPSERQVKKVIRKKLVVTSPKRRVTTNKSRFTTSSNHKQPTASREGQQDATPLFRNQTLPKRLPAGAGLEAMWDSLLRMQAKILGPEHPMTYQAKADLARSRVAGKCNFDAFRTSRDLAINTLGIAHPWVAAFTEDLNKLERLTERETSNANATIEQQPASISNVEEANTQEEGQQSPVAGQSPTEVVLPKLEVSLSERTPNDSESMQYPLEVSTRDEIWNLRRPPHNPAGAYNIVQGFVFNGLVNVALNSILWLHRNYGPEQPVKSGKVRVRWTCSCGKQLYDDFVELRAGAARELEAYLNRPRAKTGGANTPTSPSSSRGSNNFFGSSVGGAAPSQTSWSSYGTQNSGFRDSPSDTKPPMSTTGSFLYSPYSPLPEPPWLLTCANEDRYTPKLAHLDMAPHKIRSDKDLALSLRDHYFQVNKKWWRSLRIRGLTTIEFVQFEVHQNRFADIRKCPDVPPLSTGDYDFQPGDLLPPVGSQYLLHLFKHPEDYDGELITYLRSPKRNARLQFGVGWGINLVEGFLADRVWMVISSVFALGSLAFAIAWSVIKHDIQGASGIAAWIVALAVLVVGWLQAFLG